MKIKNVPISWLKDTEAKREHGNIADLKKSIEEVGLFNPITVNQDGRLLAGRRRFHAITELGWEEVTVRILESSGPVFDFKVALDENLKRKNLSDVEVAEALKEYQELKEQLEGKKSSGHIPTLKQFSSTDSLNFSKSDEGRTQQKTAEEFGISQQAVSRAIKIAQAVEEFPDLRPLQKGSVILQEAEKRKIPHVSHNSGNNEWYTPAEYIEAARSVLGKIELDPASSEIANETVKAEMFYTAEDDGLSKEWMGKVWMNPPYSTELIHKFCSKLSGHYSNGNITEAIVLVNNATETGWFNSLIEQAGAVVFPRGRVKYYTPAGEAGMPLQGQAIIYFGKNAGVFREKFKCFGWGASL